MWDYLKGIGLRPTHEKMAKISVFVDEKSIFKTGFHKSRHASLDVITLEHLEYDSSGNEMSSTILYFETDEDISKMVSQLENLKRKVNQGGKGE